MNKKISIIISSALMAVFVVTAIIVGIQMKHENKAVDKAETAAVTLKTETSSVTAAALSGFWKSEGDIKMEATITQSTIEIQWVEEDFSGIYWSGTFLAPARLVNGSKIISDGNTDVMSESMLASQDKTKEFTFEKDTLSFKLTMLGVTKVIRLVRK